MIIKSMSRKEASFSQLYDYMRHGANREDDKYRFHHNCFGRKRDQIIQEFEEQGNRLSQRKNGVFLYHEIISISRSKSLAEEKQKEILAEVVREYVQGRAKNNLVCGYMHDEKDNNLHFHLMISGNEVGKSRRHSLRKAQFSEIKTQLEKRVLEKYPELEQKQLISKDNHYRDKKESFKDTLQSIFSTSGNRAEFHQRLQAHNIGYAIRGKTITFTNKETNKKHRLKTLGILEEYQAMEQRFNQEQAKATENKNQNSSYNKAQQTEKEAENKKATEKEDAEQTPSPSGLQTNAKEWLFGDFSERDKRIKQQKKQQRKEAFKKQDQQDAQVKDKQQQSTQEKLEEAAEEWVLGDFSARDARARKEASKEHLKQWREKKAKSQNHEHEQKGKKQ